MNPGITSLTIKGFRSIRQLELKDLGRVNLITGKNNSGKSSVIEALRILASDASIPVLRRILRARDEYRVDGAENLRSLDIEDPPPVVSFFPGYPRISEVREPIILEANGGSKSFSLSISAGYTFEGRVVDGAKLVALRNEPTFSEAMLRPALEINNGSKHVVIMMELLHLNRAVLDLNDVFKEHQRTPIVFVDPCESRLTAALGPMWDQIALSDMEKEVVQALSIIEPGITGVSMVGGGDGEKQPRSTIVRSSSFPRPVPLRSFGDGMSRIFGIVLSLVNAKDGFLLIDEVENGLHYSIQVDLWRIIFRLSALLNVQVFATSHSWDTVEAFQRALAEEPSAGLLVRLTKRGQTLFVTTFREDELAIATREHIEVR
jgi:energy-coupling factor transporter ATP-binding protein EcfA2